MIKPFLYRVIAVVGPTASGKSDFAVALAQQIIDHKKELGVKGAEIISADSRQVYKGFDLSSGKITQGEMGGIPHHLLDVVPPTQQYSVAQFVQDASKVIDSLVSKNIVPIVCGGTSFWIDALLQGVSLPDVPPNHALRETLSTLSTEELFTLLQQKDPRRVDTIDPYNPHRLIRAIEIVEALGSVPAPATNPLYQSLYIGIQTDKDTLTEKIALRLDERIRQGMIDEIINAHQKGVSYDRLEELGLEFKWTARYLQGVLSLEEMKKELCNDIVHYAKRQMTWLKKNPSIVWIEKKRPDAVWPQVVSFLQD
jgi:tRNA dimethylallyltransferase